MSQVGVRVLGQEDWREYRAIRLEALGQAPEAFEATYGQEADYDQERWRHLVRRSRRLLAQVDGVATGVVSVRQSPTNPQVADLYGLWVRPHARGTGVAWQLVEAAAEQARQDGYARLSYWVATDNGRAVAFASSFGFRPTSYRRPMRAPTNDGEGDQTEIAMVLPLGSDPGTVPTSVRH